MIVSLTQQCASNPRRQLAAITIVVVIVLVSPFWAEIVGAYADAGALVSLFLVATGTAVKYGNHSNLARQGTSL